MALRSNDIVGVYDTPIISIGGGERLSILLKLPYVKWALFLIGLIEDILDSVIKGSRWIVPV